MFLFPIYLGGCVCVYINLGLSLVGEGCAFLLPMGYTDIFRTPDPKCGIMPSLGILIRRRPSSVVGVIICRRRNLFQESSPLNYLAKYHQTLTKCSFIFKFHFVMRQK